MCNALCDETLGAFFWEKSKLIYLMSITRGVFTQSPEPEAHDKVPDNNPDRIGIWKCWLLRRGENRSTRGKTSRSKDENQQVRNQPARNRTRATLVGGQCSHHCAMPAPQF